MLAHNMKYNKSTVTGGTKVDRVREGKQYELTNWWWKTENNERIWQTTSSTCSPKQGARGGMEGPPWTRTKRYGKLGIKRNLLNTMKMLACRWPGRWNKLKTWKDARWNIVSCTWKDGSTAEEIMCLRRIIDNWMRTWAESVDKGGRTVCDLCA